MGLLFYRQSPESGTRLPAAEETEEVREARASKVCGEYGDRLGAPCVDTVTYMHWQLTQRVDAFPGTYTGTFTTTTAVTDTVADTCTTTRPSPYTIAATYCCHFHRDPGTALANVVPCTGIATFPTCTTNIRPSTNTYFSTCMASHFNLQRLNNPGASNACAQLVK